MPPIQSCTTEYPLIFSISSLITHLPTIKKLAPLILNFTCWTDPCGYLSPIAISTFFPHRCLLSTPGLWNTMWSPQNSSALRVKALLIPTHAAVAHWKWSQCPSISSPPLYLDSCMLCCPASTRGTLITLLRLWLPCWAHFYCESPFSLCLLWHPVLSHYDSLIPLCHRPDLAVSWPMIFEQSSSGRWRKE